MEHRPVRVEPAREHDPLQRDAGELGTVEDRRAEHRRAIVSADAVQHPRERIGIEDGSARVELPAGTEIGGGALE